MKTKASETGSSPRLGTGHNGIASIHHRDGIDRPTPNHPKRRQGLFGVDRRQPRAHNRLSSNTAVLADCMANRKHNPPSDGPSCVVEGSQAPGIATRNGSGWKYSRSAINRRTEMSNCSAMVAKGAFAQLDRCLFWGRVELRLLLLKKS